MWVGCSKMHYVFSPQIVNYTKSKAMYLNITLWIESYTWSGFIEIEITGYL